MLNQQSTIFPKQIKIDDYESSENNHLIILESSNLLLGAGSRTSTAAIVLAKALHNLSEEGEIKFQGKSVLQFGCGVGLVGLYLSSLGANVKLCDTAALRDLIQKNIKINGQMLKGKAQFCMGSWKKTKCLGNCKDGVQNEQISTSHANKNKQECLYHLVGKCDLTIACECGGLQDLQSQLLLMGRQGMILAFMKRQNWDEGLDQRSLQQYLNEKSYEHERITSYHPDYVDNRIAIYRIYPRMSGEGTNKMASTGIDLQEQVSRKVQMMNFTD